MSAAYVLPRRRLSIDFSVANCAPNGAPVRPSDRWIAPRRVAREVAAVDHLTPDRRRARRSGIPRDIVGPGAIPAHRH
jgi:hypothetical protein